MRQDSTASHDCAGSYLPGLHVRFTWVGKDDSKAGSLWFGLVETAQGHPLIFRFSHDVHHIATAISPLQYHYCNIIVRHG
jgi:hypothetical protein